MRTLLVDGEWNLKRNYSARDIKTLNGEHCGGIFGFLETLGRVLKKTFPDRIIVVWDGEMSGKLRRSDYSMYKHDHKIWDEEFYYKTEYQLNEEDKRKISISNQKRKLKNLFENLFIRQVEAEYVEGDDLIAQYILTKDEDEEIIIYSRDKDYYQLVDEKVSVLRPSDNRMLTIENHKSLLGYTHKNALLIKCINGDASDNIPGVPGVSLKTVLKYFPEFADEEYDVDRLIDEAFNLYSKQTKSKKSKKLEAIIGSRHLLTRNYKLMNLREPYLTPEAKEEIETIKNCVLAKEDGFVDRSVDDAVKTFMKEGYFQYVYNNDVNAFFTPYYRASAKEKEYTKRILESFRNKDDNEQSD